MAQLTSPSTSYGTVIEIRHGQVLNVELLDHAKRQICLLCFAPRGDLRVSDVMLAQKLALEELEIEPITVAHRTPVWEDLCGREWRRWR